MRQLNKIIVHCSDSPQGRGDDASTIHDWHLERSWAGIGYHWVILEDGTLQMGRPEYWVGAHASGDNSDSIGIVLIGKDEFTKDQYAALYILIRAIMKRYGRLEVAGHCDYSDKPCPNFNVKQWYYGAGSSGTGSGGGSEAGSGSGSGSD